MKALCPLFGVVNLVVGTVVGCFIVATTDSVFLNGSVYAIFVIIILFNASPMEVARTVVVLDSIDMVHKGLILRWEAMERPANYAVDLVVLAMELNLAVAVAVVGAERPRVRKAMNIVAGWHEDSSVAAAPKSSNRILLDLHDSPRSLSIYTENDPAEAESFCLRGISNQTILKVALSPPALIQLSTLDTAIRKKSPSSRDRS